MTHFIQPSIHTLCRQQAFVSMAYHERILRACSSLMNQDWPSTCMHMFRGQIHNNE